jgi:uncharacterized membrane protein YdbT with pleckstrin-like domain
MADQAPEQPQTQQTKSSEQHAQPLTDETAQVGERTLYVDNPAMFRNHPLGYIGCWLLVIVGLTGLVFWALPAENTPLADRFATLPYLMMGIGVLSIGLLIRWWIKVLATKLTVTNERTMVRRGLLSRHTNEVWHDNVRNVQVYQSLMQRVFSVGRVQISSAGQAEVEIDVSGLPHPQRIREVINQHREE